MAFFRLSDLIFSLTFLVSWIGFMGILLSLNFNFLIGSILSPMFGILAAFFHRIMFIIFRKYYLQERFPLHALWIVRKQYGGMLLLVIFILFLSAMIYVLYRAILSIEWWLFFVFPFLVILCFYIVLNFISALLLYSQKTLK